MKEGILDVQTHFKPTESFQYTHFRKSFSKANSKTSEHQIFKSYIWRKHYTIHWVTPVARAAFGNWTSSRDKVT